MHILEIPSFFPPMGGDFCLEQSKALLRHGHQVAVLACNQYGITHGVAAYFSAKTSLHHETLEGVTTLRSDMHGIPLCVRLNQKLWCNKVMQLYRYYRQRYGRPDILHAHCCQWAGVAARMIGEAEHVPYYITEHLPSALLATQYGQNWERHPWARLLMKETYECANAVITVSDELEEDLAPYFGTSYRRITISNVIDTDYFQFRERMPRQGRPFRFCCLANAHGDELNRKGYDLLAKAANGLEGCEIHIAGRGTERKDLRCMFPDNTIWHGLLNKQGVRELLYKCDALVLATRSESAGLVLYEAAATGIPYVTTDCVPRAMRLPKASLTARTGDADSLRHMMRLAMTLNTDRQITSEAVRKIASPETVATRLENLFAESL
ncbi:glycosyltransferase [bacterium]|nr:glycosyltransferase [bacterium]